VGGSATTDGGLGALEALDEAGGLGGAEVVVACDVQTRFVDAASVFGPQKGASPDQVAQLRRRLEALAEAYRRRTGGDVAALAGSGAAGGLGGGLVVAGARLVPGFYVVADAVGLRARLARARLVLTGEGRLDASTWAGKVVAGVCREAARRGRPVVVVAGEVSDDGARAGLEVVDLSARFGPRVSLADPARCVTEAVRAALADRET